MATAEGDEKTKRAPGDRQDRPQIQSPMEGQRGEGEGGIIWDADG